MDNTNLIILAYDGDDAGKLVGRAILANDVKGLAEVSQRINIGHEIVKRWVQEVGGRVISGGGDEGTFRIPTDALDHVEVLRNDYHFATNLTMTVGVGKTLSEAGKALMVGKFRGKNQIVMYSPEVDQEIEESNQKIQEGTASFEEQKLGHAYLRPEGEQMHESDLGIADEELGQESEQGLEHDPKCQFCNDSPQMENEECPFCQENSQEHDPNSPDHDPDCPFCQENAAAEEHNPDEPNHDPNCPFCQENAIGEELVGDDDGGDDQDISLTDGPDSVSSPTTRTSENFEGNGLPEPDMPKPDAISDNPDGLGTTIDDPTIENQKLDADQDPQISINPNLGDDAAGESAQDILAQIDELPSDKVPQEGEEGMEDGVSRPEDYPDDVPGDMGLADQPVEEEDQPDLSAVLQEGLDSHADNIQKEKVIQMVGEALEGFKACKDIIEKAQQQAPQLYSASLSMLKAMIEMARMLGLDQNPEQPMENPLEEEPQDENQGPTDHLVDFNGAPGSEDEQGLEEPQDENPTDHLADFSGAPQSNEVPPMNPGVGAPLPKPKG